MNIKARIRKALPLMTAKQRNKVIELLDLQALLLEVRDKIGEVVGRNNHEYNGYTKGWLTAFASDADQSGSIVGLIDSIISEYVDEDGKVWED
jgi:hypothetical protein